MKIINSKEEDIPKIFQLYKLATEYQKTKFPENEWPQFEETLVQTEVAENRQFKLVIDDKIACIWAITYSDPSIWEGADNEVSIYIHRIATNPDYRGNNFVKVIADWAIKWVKNHNRRFIRMDTCGRNQKLIDHYESCGFEFLGIKKLKNTTELPAHYHNAEVCFFEIRLK